MKKVTKIVWHDARIERPTDSGYYLTITPNGTVADMEYSKVYDLFNAADAFDRDFVDRHCIDVLLWAYKDPIDGLVEQYREVSESEND